MSGCLAALGSAFIFAQGPLTPPGAPAPTLKTLDQLEARTPISKTPFSIDASGSYYLTQNLSVTSGDAIVITADDVTLDLNGFTLSSTASPASGTAVSLPSGLRRNVTIRNGHVRGATTFSGGTFTTGGFLHGVRSISGGSNLRVTELSVFGIAQTGINLSSNRTCVIERCLVAICGSLGIAASQVRDCSAETCGTFGIIGTDLVRDSSGESVGTGVTNDGISAGRAINCTGVANGGRGIFADSLITNCEGTSTSGIGLSSGTASFSRGKRDGATAIAAPITIGCTVNGTGTVASAQKFLGTP